jgi:hypothetical protein
MLGIGKKKAKDDPAKQVVALTKQLGERDAQIARLMVEVEARQMQITFWHEQCRNFENQLKLAQGLHFNALDLIRKINEVPPDMETEIERIQAALAAQPGIESLIMAVALSSSRDVDMLRRLLPEIADRLPAPAPAVQRISDVSGERTALRG